MVMDKILYSLGFLSLFLSLGCAVSTQRFQDVSYDSEGVPVRIIKAKSRTYSPPFLGAKSLDDHKLFMLEEKDGWSVEMGTVSELKGGEMTKEADRILNAIGLVGLR